MPLELFAGKIIAFTPASTSGKDNKVETSFKFHLSCVIAGLAASFG
jgi:hypothetical protein